MSIQSNRDLRGMSEVGAIVARTLREMERHVRPGVTTADLDAVAARVLRQHGAQPAPQLHFGFPGATCISVNDEAVHGIPGARVIQAGDLVKLDVTAERDGYIADAAVTVAVPPASALTTALRACATTALRKAIAVAQAGRPINCIGRAVTAEVRRQGFTVLPELCGHGTGRAIWEEPTVPNFYDRRRQERLTEGLVITIEPIIAAGAGRAVKAADGWTLLTADRSLAAHFEHTLVIRQGHALVLTALS